MAQNVFDNCGNWQSIYYKDCKCWVPHHSHCGIFLILSFQQHFVVECFLLVEKYLWKYLTSKAGFEQRATHVLRTLALHPWLSSNLCLSQYIRLDQLPVPSGIQLEPPHWDPCLVLAHKLPLLRTLGLHPWLPSNPCSSQYIGIGRLFYQAFNLSLYIETLVWFWPTDCPYWEPLVYIHDSHPTHVRPSILGSVACSIRHSTCVSTLSPLSGLEARILLRSPLAASLKALKAEDLLWPNCSSDL